MNLHDQHQREQATDPCTSFIVQAPAGSGKTEMLSQRFLRLLACVQAPEQIVALTFTRKAAAEMRERILLSLQRAARNETAETAHQQQTLQWAAAALRHAERLQWNILKQPHRLRILTIDALCQQICQAIPVQEKTIPFADINENSTLLYEQAARSCIHYALEHPSTREHITRILIHLDNNQTKLIELFCRLLANRDQWLPLVLEAGLRSQKDFEQDLAHISAHEISRFKTLFPQNLQSEFLTLVRIIADINRCKDHDFGCLKNCSDFTNLNQEQVKALLPILLTKQDSLRGKYDHHLGLKKDRVNDETYQQVILESTRIQNCLRNVPGFVEYLTRLRCLPEPNYQEEQWKVLQSLLELLPQLAAHLHLLFSESTQVDFSAVSQQANHALGSEENPTDLALFFDNSIHHLLIDEFQDTSLNQYELIRKFVMGWEKGDGRTLFLVGDPMQSIYRFRQAEVGLFLKAREEGIGPVSLIPLELSTNFRSCETLVHWVNQQFKEIFPAQDDIEAGAIRYHSSFSIHPGHADSFISACCYPDSGSEAQGIVDIIRRELQTEPNQKIAVLVRSRSNLTDLINRLRQENMPFQGVDIDLLSTLPHIQDVWSLTRALLFPANRLAWLALLRSPFCGLSLQEIHQLVSQQPKASFLEIMERSETADIKLSGEGRQRVQHFIGIMQIALQQRHQYKLIEHLALVVQQLGGDSLYNAQQQADIEQFWKLLAQFEHDNMLTDIKQIQDALQNLYAQQTNSAPLQIMTIHKSKGLEFDTVILPHLGTKKKPADKPLIRWLHLPQKDRPALFLLAPLKAEYETQSSLYNFLHALDDEKDDYESQRLLYVAITRAKHRLYLCSHKDKPEKSSLQSLLNVEFTAHSPAALIQDTNRLPLLQRLPLTVQTKKSMTDPIRFNKIRHTDTYNRSAIIGTLCHDLLQYISEKQNFILDALPWLRVENELCIQGIPLLDQQEILSQIRVLMEKILNDEVGRWILNSHPMALNETALMEVTEQGVQLKIPDRFFRDDQGRLWVIDFKTGQQKASHQKTHQEQVANYARMLQQLYIGDAIHCGIYYLEHQGWHSWPYASGDNHERQ